MAGANSMHRNEAGRLALWGMGQIAQVTPSHSSLIDFQHCQVVRLLQDCKIQQGNRVCPPATSLVFPPATSLKRPRAYYLLFATLLSMQLSSIFKIPIKLVLWGASGSPSSTIIVPQAYFLYYIVYKIAPSASFPPWYSNTPQLREGRHLLFNLSLR